MALSNRSESEHPGQERSDNGPGIVFCWCPSGSFRMGSDDVFDTFRMRFVTPEEVASQNWSPRVPDESAQAEEDIDEDDDDDDNEPTSYWGRFPDESPVEVTFSRGFWIGKHPVTQAQYEAVMGPGSQFSKFRDRDDSPVRPVESVEWNDAAMFCRELTDLERAAGRLPEGWVYRLPSEAQWEYACRAGTRSRYFAGDGEEDLQRVAFFRTLASRYDPVARRNEETHAVGQRTPNAWGLHDTLGNVEEWCRDGYESVLPGGPDPFVLSVNERGERVVRGGSFRKGAHECRVSSRSSQCPDYRSESRGFRVAMVCPLAGEPVDSHERSAKSALFTRRKAAVEGRPIPQPPETHDELHARAEAFLAKPSPGVTSEFYTLSDAMLQSYLTGEFPPDMEQARAVLVLAILATEGDVKPLYGDEEDHMNERAALYRGMYQLLYGQEPGEYQYPGDGEGDGEDE